MPAYSFNAFHCSPSNYHRLAALTAYGLSDLQEVGIGGLCPRTTCEVQPNYYDEPEQEDRDPMPKGFRSRWPYAAGDEVLTRLLKLNATRAGEERAAALAEAPTDSPQKRRLAKAALHAEQVRQHHETAGTPLPANPSTEVDRLARALNDSAPEHLRKL